MACSQRSITIPISGTIRPACKDPCQIDERGDALVCAAGHGRELRGVSARAGEGLGHGDSRRAQIWRGWTASEGSERRIRSGRVQRLRYFAVESFRPGIYPVAAFYADWTMANSPTAYPPEWRHSLPGFARNYDDFMASWASVQGGKFVVASLVHE
jgi:hypothetical protein